MNKTKTMPLTSNLSIEQIFDYCDINVEGIDKEEFITLVVEKVDYEYESGRAAGYRTGLDDGSEQGWQDGYSEGYSDGKREAEDNV